ncbi:unnamed protein product, partial [Didymodactylos carnosus]
PELRINDLWKVWQWDEKWMQFSSRKEKLLSMFERMEKYKVYLYEHMNDDDQEQLSTKLLTDCDIDKERLNVCQTFEELEDLREQFYLYYANDIPQMRLMEKMAEYKEEKEKRKQMVNLLEDGDDEQQQLHMHDEHDDMDEETQTKNDLYSLCKQGKLDGLAKKFGLKPDKFGENLHDGYQKNEIDQYPIDPIQTCEDYITKQFPDTKSVLQAVVYMHAKQLSMDPLVRYVIRKEYIR